MTPLIALLVLGFYTSGVLGVLISTADLATEYNATVNAKDVDGKEREFEVTYFSEFSSLDCSYQLILRNCSSENIKLRESVISESLVKFFEKNFKLQDLELLEVKSSNNYRITSKDPYLLLADDEDDLEFDISDQYGEDRTQIFRYVEKRVDRLDKYVPSYFSLGFTLSPEGFIEDSNPFLLELGIEYRPLKNLEIGTSFMLLDSAKSYTSYDIGIEIGYLVTHSMFKKAGLRSVGISYSRHLAFVSYTELYETQVPDGFGGVSTNEDYNYIDTTDIVNGLNISFSQKFGFVFDLKYLFHQKDIIPPKFLFAVGMELDVWNR